MKKPAVFFDRDGVINELLFHQEMGVIETPFTVAQFKLKKHAGEAVRAVNRMGLLAVIVSNQPGLAMGNFSRKTLDGVNRKMVSLLGAKGGKLDGIYYCTHHPTKGRGVLRRKCACRKPKPGLLLQAAKDLGIDLKKSFMIGDSITDVQAGRAAGCRTLLLAHLKCDLCHLMAKKGIRPHFMARDLKAAVNIIKKS